MGLLLPFGLVVLGAGTLGFRALSASNPSVTALAAALPVSTPAPEPPPAKAVPLGSYLTILTPADPASQSQAQGKLLTPPAAPQQAAAVLPPAAVPVPQQVAAVPLEVAPQAAAPQPMPAVLKAAAAAQVPNTLLMRLAGSDALGGKLARRLTFGYLASIGDSEISLVQGGADRTAEVTGLQSGQSETIQVASVSPAGGFAALLRGTADMAMSPRRILPSEADRLSSLGDMTGPANEAVIGIQGVAAIVSPANRLSSLTVSQLRGILTGRFTDWSQVGGVAGPIHVVVMDQDGAASAPQDILAGQDDVTGAAYRVPSEQTLAAVVATDSANIGFARFGNTGSAKVLAVAEDGASPIVPTDLSISTETYPLSRRLYVYTSPALPNQFVKRFVAYVFSAAGQTAVAAEGLVPLTIRVEQAIAPDAASGRFKQLVAGASRLSVNFHFQPGSVELDGRGLRDLDLVVAYLRSQRVDPGRVILAGFADNNGPAAANQAVAQRRAEAIVAALGRFGIVPGKTATFGAELPVADNTTPEGRERNRRVEVYVAP